MLSTDGVLSIVFSDFLWENPVFSAFYTEKTPGEKTAPKNISEKSGEI